MTTEQIDEERRRGRNSGIAAIAGIVIFVAAMGLAGDFNGAEQAEQLKMFDSVSSDLLLQCILQAIALLLFLPALITLFRAIQTRVENFRPGLIGVVIVSPILLAISLVVAYFAYKSAADAFLEPGKFDTGSNDVANDVFYDQFPTQIRTGLGLAGSLGLAFTTVFLALNGMRAGLMTRFWGTLAMALGIGTLLFGSVMLIGYMLLIALLIAGWWPGSRPPAWEAGEAVPWPKPGQPSNVQQEGDGLAAPGDFEGTATEIEDPAALSEPDSDPSRPARRDNKRKRKRKQRS